MVDDYRPVEEPFGPDEPDFEESESRDTEGRNTEDREDAEDERV